MESALSLFAAASLLSSFLSGFGGIAHDAPRELFLGSFFPVTATRQDLYAKYNTAELKILIVPGHDNEQSGAEWRGTREADLTLAAGKYLHEFLSSNNRFRVWSARDFRTGEYTEDFSRYFKERAGEIASFRENLRSVMAILTAAHLVEDNDVNHHGFAPDDVSLRLYGVNKWANEHTIDVTLHLHFNDYPRKRKRAAGEYSGFAIYIPERQYPNAEASKDFARTIFEELRTIAAVSNLPQEQSGIIEDQGLIAVGANASRNGVSLLIEYGYLYEPQFASSALRDAVVRELAFRTARGIVRYFDPSLAAQEFETTLLPYTWDETLESGAKGRRDVLALQGALIKEGVYPPAGKDLRDCPLSGNFGPCTREAVRAFQGKYRDEILTPAGLSYGSGIVGEATMRKLNELYGT